MSNHWYQVRHSDHLCQAAERSSDELLVHMKSIKLHIPLRMDLHLDIVFEDPHGLILGSDMHCSRCAELHRGTNLTSAARILVECKVGEGLDQKSG